MTIGIDIDALKAALAVAEAKASEAEARAANAAAKVSDAEAEIAFLKLTIEKLRREMYGWRSERKQRLLDQLELQLDELEASATEDELAAEQAAVGTTEVKGFTRRKPARKPFPAHLPRERVVVPPPTSCACCGSDRLSKIGEDAAEVALAPPVAAFAHHLVEPAGGQIRIDLQRLADEGQEGIGLRAPAPPLLPGTPASARTRSTVE